MTIAIIDKYPIARSGIRHVLQIYFIQSSILEADSIWSYREEFPDQIPDIIIISIGQQMLTSDIKVIQFVKKFYSVSSTVVYDERIDSVMVRKYFRLGVLGYLSKQDDLSEFLMCLEKISRGIPFIGTNLIYKLIKTIDFFDKQGPPNSNIRLTDRQHEIAVLLAEGQKTSQIASKLKKTSSTISTVKSTIFKKMKVNNIVDLRLAMTQA